MQAKPWYSSKGLVSAFVGLLGLALNFFHVNIADLTPALGDALVQWVSDLLTLAGLVGTIVGRVRAAHVLTLSRSAAVEHNAVLTLSQAQIAVPARASASALPAYSTPTRPVDLNQK